MVLYEKKSGNDKYVYMYIYIYVCVSFPSHYNCSALTHVKFVHIIATSLFHSVQLYNLMSINHPQIKIDQMDTVNIGILANDTQQF